MTMLAGCLVIVLAIYAVYRQIEVRLVLLGAGLTLGALAHNADAIVRKFFETFTDEKFVVPICTALGFSYVIRHTGCDQHLVRLLVEPMKKARFLLIPGTVVVGFLVNMPVVSQTSTAVTIGPVIIPLLLAARISPRVIGAAILLGSSIGGELLNPGAPELRTTIEASNEAARELHLERSFDSRHCVKRILPLNLLGLVVATSVFWLLNLRREPKFHPEEDEPSPQNLRVSPLKAAIPLLPLALLYATAPPFNWITLEQGWLVPENNKTPGLFDSRLIGSAMLLGSAVAGLVVWRKFLDVGREFFEGAGYGFANVVSLIVAANCFGEGIKQLGLARILTGWIGGEPALLLASAGGLSLAFACLSGSGMAATQSLFGFFAGPSLQLGIDPAHTGAVVSLASAAGRTMSPVSAVNLMSARLTGTTPWELSRLVALPLIASTATMVLAAIWLRMPP